MNGKKRLHALESVAFGTGNMKLRKTKAVLAGAAVASAPAAAVAAELRDGLAEVAASSEAQHVLMKPFVAMAEPLVTAMASVPSIDVARSIFHAIQIVIVRAHMMADRIDLGGDPPPEEKNERFTQILEASKIALGL